MYIINSIMTTNYSMIPTPLLHGVYSYKVTSIVVYTMVISVYTCIY